MIRVFNIEKKYFDCEPTNTWMHYRVILSFALLLTANLTFSQPFVCDGDFYLSQTEQGSNTQIYRVLIDPVTGDAIFDPLPMTIPTELNAIGYRITDNYIYGVNPTTNELWRINNDGSGDLLTTLTGINDRDYIAGDVTADGRYLVLSGLLNLGNNANLVLVDLDDPNYATTEIDMPGTTRFADFSFDPFTGILYAFDSPSDRLCTVDLATGDVTFLNNNSGINDLVMGATFFNSFGTMFGYGGLQTDDIQLRLFRFDKNAGTGQLIATGPPASFNDGCSCPYTIELRKRVLPMSTFPCIDIFYTFQIANITGIDQTGITFNDVFPPNFTITDIPRNPFVGNIVSGIGTNTLRIEDMIIPPGIDSFTVQVNTGVGTAPGIYGNQATLENLPAAFGGNKVSDNPLTLVQDDSTFVQINPLDIDLSNQNSAYCEGDTLLLNAGTFGVTYLWNDGSTDSTLSVTQPGTYSVAISSGCETSFDTIVVEEIENIEVDLGPDISINLGDTIYLEPDVNFSGTIAYQWEENGSNPSISCLDCPEPTARPFFDAKYSVTVTTPQGCEDEDILCVFVDRSRNIFVPNAFSPNGDNINDRFYVQGKGNDRILRFQIFDRWGGLMYEASDISVNDALAGWNGRVGDKLANIGVYVWLAEVEFLDGITEVYKGDVTLVR